MAVASYVLAAFNGDEPPPIPKNLGLLDKLEEQSGRAQEQGKIQHFIPGAPDVLAT